MSGEQPESGATVNSNSGAVEMEWLTFEEMVNHFISLPQETLQESWKLRAYQAEVFHSALKLFLQAINIQ